MSGEERVRSYGVDNNAIIRSAQSVSARERLTN